MALAHDTNKQFKRKEQKKYVRKKCKLKTLETIGNCQRPVFLLGVNQQMQKI